MLAFRKMHGLGNDFVVLDARDAPISLPVERIRLIGDRRRGIGFDQLLVLEPSPAGNDVFMRIFNPDGSEAGACGNGTRCVADLVMAEECRDSLTLETLRGTLSAFRHEGLVSVDMGAALFDWHEIPLAEPLDTFRLPIAEGPLIEPVAVGMGNPHCVFFVADADAVDLEHFGPRLEHHPLFPERTNVEVASILNDGGQSDSGQNEGRIRLRVWERGAGITLACGSGTCAAAVAAHMRGLVDVETHPVRMDVDGGVMTIQWRASSDGHVIMSGPVATSFVGEMAL